MGIVGLDYCGSTLISNVMSGLPGVINAGESHWIIDRNLGCRECHSKPCPVFDGLLLGELRSLDLETESWWGRIGQHTGAELIISSDKLPRHYDRFGCPDYLLYLHKSPESNIISWCKRKFRIDGEIPDQFSSEQILSGMRWWIEISTANMEWLSTQDSDISEMSLESFSSNPKSMLKSICGWLGIEYDHTAIEFWNRELHYIGGNHSVKRTDPGNHFYKRVVKDNRWESLISEGDLRAIMDNSEIQSINKRIMQICHAKRSSFFRLP